MDKFTCKHYEGSRNECCRAGVKYATFETDKPGDAFRKPCIQWDEWHKRQGTTMSDGQLEAWNERGTCEKREVPSDAEIAESEAGMQAAIDRLVRFNKFIGRMKHEHRKKGFAGIVECPECKGKLHMTVSSYNGHTRGRCATERCFSWIE